jgi:hypothetical protein
VVGDERSPLIVHPTVPDPFHVLQYTDNFHANLDLNYTSTTTRSSINRPSSSLFISKDASLPGCSGP